MAQKNCSALSTVAYSKVKPTSTAAIVRILESHSPTLTALSRGDGGRPIDVAAIVAAMLQATQNRLNLPRMMSQQALEATANDLMSEFYWLTLQDVQLILRRAEMGHYGEFYQMMNEPMVFKWVRMYVDERLNIAEARSMAADRERDRARLTPEEMHKIYEQQRIEGERLLEESRRRQAEREQAGQDLQARAEQQRRELAMMFPDLDGGEEESL